MARLLPSLIYGISSKLKPYKLKKFSDKIFIFIENFLLNFYNLHRAYLDIYDDMTDNEIKLANISKDDKILHIGCGSLPASCILIAKKIGASITGIDNNLKSVKYAQLCIKKYNLIDKIEIKFSDARNFPFEKFDVIFVSQGISPQKKILKNIANKMKNNSRIIFRSISNKKNELNKNDLFIIDIFKMDKIVHHKENGPLISILLCKKQN